MPTSTPLAHSGPGPDGLLPETATEPRPTGTGGPPVRAVVVGVDGGECALGAVRWATEEAHRRGAPLRLVHAAPYLGRPGEPGTIPPFLPRARRIAAQAYTVAKHALGHHTARDVLAETEVVPEDPVPALLRAAEGAQLVVLGIATTGALDELVLAPVAEKVVARSTTPVVVVPRPRGTPAPDRPVVALLGLSEAEDDEPVADWAAEAARRTGAAVHVVLTRGAGTGARDWAERFGDLAVTVTDLRDTSPADVLRAVGPAPLIVLGAGHGGFLHRSLDGRHRYFLRHCTSPMALIPPVHRAGVEPREESTGPA